MNINKITYCFFITSLLLLYSCTTIELQQGEVNQRDIERLENTVKNDSLNLNALKQLAISLVRAHQNNKAKTYLVKASSKMPDDEALLFYRGLNYEFLNDTLSAIKYYSRYKETSLFSPYRKLMEGRYLHLNRSLVYEDIKRRVADEGTLSVKDAPSNTLAVFPLNYYGSDKKYEPLSRGLSEMISIDLGKVKKLTVLERIRIKAILDELKFSSSSAVDPSTAPRMGKLLRAGLLYSGSFSINEEQDLKMDVNSWDIVNNNMGNWLNKSGKMEDIFLIEKELVFAIINQLGIQLNNEEREQIQLIPTKNINAFLEYSKGLEMLDNGQYKEASQYFSRAAEMDPGFKEASVKSDASSSAIISSGSSDAMLDQTTGLGESAGITESSIKEDIILNRLDIIGNDIRTTFEQGPEKREAPQEAATANGLPMPPARPVRK